MDGVAGLQLMPEEIRKEERRKLGRAGSGLADLARHQREVDDRLRHPHTFLYCKR